jgi:hypothetical protein
MKTLSIITLLLVAASTASFAQCNNDDLVNASVAGLAPGYCFLKSYKINGENDLEKVEFSYVLTRGTEYVLNLKEKNAASTVVTLYDAKRNKIASNKISGSLASAIAFSCGATGIYYITYTFESVTDRCAGSTLGFKR